MKTAHAASIEWGQVSGHRSGGIDFKRLLQARLEGGAILAALAERVRQIELAGPPSRKLNNTLRAFASLPVRVIA
jgi:hypothetical protein